MASAVASFPIAAMRASRSATSLSTARRGLAYISVSATIRELLQIPPDGSGTIEVGEHVGARLDRGAGDGVDDELDVDGTGGCERP